MSQIKLTILGTTAGVPTRERAHAAIYFEFDDDRQSCFLFDCGENAQRQIMKAGLNIMKIKNIFITHWHGDHCLGLPGIIDTMGFEGREEPLLVYAPEARRVKKCINFSYSIGKYKVQPKFVPFKGKHITRIVDQDRFAIDSVPVEHSVPTVAYAFIEKEKRSIDKEKAVRSGLPEEGRIYKELKESGRVMYEGKEIFLDDLLVTEPGRKVVYSGDTMICENLRNIAQGADLLVQDCTYFGDDEARAYKHASLPEVMKMVKELEVKRTVLTHISRKFGDINELKEMVSNHPDLEVAEDFMQIKL